MPAWFTRLVHFNHWTTMHNWTLISVWEIEIETEQYTDQMTTHRWVEWLAVKKEQGDHARACQKGRSEKNEWLTVTSQTCLNKRRTVENPLRDLQLSMGSSCVFWVSKELITKRPIFCSSTPQYHPRPLSLSCLLSLWLLYCPSYNPSRE